MSDAAFDRSRIEEWIVARAARRGFDPAPATVRFLAFHACRVLEEAAELQLTSIRDPDEFLARHVGESLEGAALIPRGTALCHVEYHPCAAIFGLAVMTPLE